MEPLEYLRKIWVPRYDAKLRIGQNPGQLFEKLRAGKKKKLTCSAGPEDTGWRSLPSYRRDQSVGVQDNFQERRALRVASLTTPGFSPAFPTAE